MVRAVPLPASIPSLFMNTMLTALPPAVVGVIADTNSHSMVILKHCHQLSFLSLSTLKRHASPVSLPRVNSSASAIPAMAVWLQDMERHVSMSKSRAMSHPTTAMPMPTGNNTLTSSFMESFIRMFLVAMLKDTYKSSKYKEKPATIAFF